MEDRRGRKVAFAAHCLLNQNAKATGLAGWAATVKPIIDILDQAGIGIIQLPCPEYEYYGLNRPAGADTKEQYDCPEYQDTCFRLSRTIVDQVRRYRESGYEVACLLGIEGSPSCSVFTVPTGDGPVAGSGIFFEILLRELRLANIEVPVFGVPEAADLSDAILELQGLLS